MFRSHHWLPENVAKTMLISSWCDLPACPPKELDIDTAVMDVSSVQLQVCSSAWLLATNQCFHRRVLHISVLDQSKAPIASSTSVSHHIHALSMARLTTARLSRNSPINVQGPGEDAVFYHSCQLAVLTDHWATWNCTASWRLLIASIQVYADQYIL